MRFDHGIAAVDSGYQRPLLDAIHVIVENRRAAIVDTGTRDSVPRVLAALAELGLTPAAVDYVFLTHIHLDHAGGAGALMQACPNAMLTVHPRGARHMADPSKLWEGTVAVYGADEARRIYGSIEPVPKARIMETPHEHAIRWGRRELRFFDTPGHARHHVVIHDSRSGHVFAGDTFGLSYRELDEAGRSFVFPSSSPTHFEPDAYHRSLELIVGLRPGAVYMTHYSQRLDVGHIAERMHDLVDQHAALARKHRAAGADRLALLEEGVTQIVLGEARRLKLGHSEALVRELYALDIGLNAQGLVVYGDSL